MANVVKTLKNVSVIKTISEKYNTTEPIVAKAVKRTARKTSKSVNEVVDVLHHSITHFNHHHLHVMNGKRGFTVVSKRDYLTSRERSTLTNMGGAYIFSKTHEYVRFKDKSMLVKVVTYVLFDIV